MSFMLSSSAAVDLWKVDASELSDAGPNAPEHFWAVSKGYAAGFLTDAVSEDDGVRIVAALKSEHTQLFTVSTEEIRKASPIEKTLRGAANCWAFSEGFGGGVLILERKTGHCLVAATDKRFVRMQDVVGEVSSVHQHAKKDRDVVTAFLVQRFGSGVAMLRYYRVDIEVAQEEDEQQPAAASSMLSSSPAIVPVAVEQERDDEEDGQQPAASSSMLSSSPAVDLWSVPVAELSEAKNAKDNWSTNAAHHWAVSKGYAAGFLTDAVNEDSGVRVVAALRSEHTQLLTVSTKEIWQAYPTPTGRSRPSLRFAANYWAARVGYGGGALIQVLENGDCLVAATDTRFVINVGTDDVASCHQDAVTDSDAITAFFIERMANQEVGSNVVMLTYYRIALEDDDEEDDGEEDGQQPTTPA